jgi:hypothetical protein
MWLFFVINAGCIPGRKEKNIMAFAVCEARKGDYPISEEIMAYVEPAVLRYLAERYEILSDQIAAIYYVLDSGLPTSDNDALVKDLP